MNFNEKSEMEAVNFRSSMYENHKTEEFLFFIKKKIF